MRNKKKDISTFSWSAWLYAILIIGGVAAAIVNFVLPTIWPNDKPPIAKINTNSAEGQVPLTILLDGAKSFDPEGGVLYYAWEIDGNIVSNQVCFRHTFESPKEYHVMLAVKDSEGLKNTDSIIIHAFGLDQNGQPEIKITDPNERDRVCREAVIRGEYRNVPNGLDIWMLVYATGAQRYFPQDIVTTFNDNTWQVNVLVGSTDTSDVGKAFIIVVITADARASAELRGRAEGILVMPSGTEERDRVTVFRGDCLRN